MVSVAASLISCGTFLILCGTVTHASRAFHAHEIEAGVEQTRYSHQRANAESRESPLRIVSLGGFPDTVGRKSRSFLNGRFSEQRGEAFRMNGRETYWSQDHNYMIYHCPKHNDWRVGWRKDWGPHTACECWAFAHTSAGADILNPEGTPFIGVSDHKTWHLLEGRRAGVVALGIQPDAGGHVTSPSPPTWPSGASSDCGSLDSMTEDVEETIDADEAWVIEWMGAHRPCYNGVDVNTASFRHLIGVSGLDQKVASAILFGRTCPLKSSTALRQRLESMDEEGAQNRIWSHLQPLFESDELCVGCWGPRGIYRDDDEEGAAADVNRASKKRLEAIDGLSDDLIHRIFMARTCFYHNAEEMNVRIHKEAPATDAGTIWQTINEKLSTGELCIGQKLQ